MKIRSFISFISFILLVRLLYHSHGVIGRVSGRPRGGPISVGFLRAVHNVQVFIMLCQKVGNIRTGKERGKEKETTKSHKKRKM